jgi:predicted RNA-binding protein with PUA-like domain
VDLAPVLTLQKPVFLETIKADRTLEEIPLVKQSRLSVTPLTEIQFNRLMVLAETDVAGGKARKRESGKAGR